MLLCTLLSDFHPHLPLNASVGLALDERPRFSLLERPPLLRYYIYSEMQKWGLALTNELESTDLLLGMEYIEQTNMSGRMVRQRYPSLHLHKAVLDSHLLYISSGFLLPITTNYLS